MLPKRGCHWFNVIHVGYYFADPYNIQDQTEERREPRELGRVNITLEILRRPPIFCSAKLRRFKIDRIVSSVPLALLLETAFAAMDTDTRIFVAFDLYDTLLSTASISKDLANFLEIAKSLALLWRRYQLEYTWRLNSLGELPHQRTISMINS